MMMREDLKEATFNFLLSLGKTLTDDCLLKVVDQYGNIEFASDNHVEFLNMPLADYEGKCSFDFVHHNDRQTSFNRFLKSVITNEPVSISFRYRCPCGDTVYMYSEVIPFLSEKKYVVLSREVVCFSDVMFSDFVEDAITAGLVNGERPIPR